MTIPETERAVHPKTDTPLLETKHSNQALFQSERLRAIAIQFITLQVTNRTDSPRILKTCFVVRESTFSIPIIAPASRAIKARTVGTLSIFAID